MIRIRAKVADFGLARFEVDDARKKHNRMRLHSQFSGQDEDNDEEEKEESYIDDSNLSMELQAPGSPSKEILLTAGHGTPLYIILNKKCKKKNLDYT